jgi:hypothetical protein
MNTILQFVQQRKTLVTLIGGGLLGLLLGLLIAWVLWPVQWTNATPGHLRSDFQSGYILWVAEQYASAGDHPDDLDWARARLGVEYWKEGQLAETFGRLEEEYSGEELIRLRALAQVLESAPEATPAEPQPGGGTSGWMMICGVALLVVVCVGGVVFLVSRVRARRVEPEVARPSVGVARPPSEGVAWGIGGPPLVQFVTTYTLGDDHYDPSFSIELESGEFMGECGVGISETIGVGAPNKVTAFEVWLFDKSDIRTVTKVLMSDYAFHDDALSTKLAPKGEPVLAETERDIVLETKTLRVRARIVEADYGMGNLPPNSFFERLTIDLVAWVIPGQEGAQPAADASAPIESATL